MLCETFHMDRRTSYVNDILMIVQMNLIPCNVDFIIMIFFLKLRHFQTLYNHDNKTTLYEHLVTNQSLRQLTFNNISRQFSHISNTMPYKIFTYDSLCAIYWLTIHCIPSGTCMHQSDILSRVKWMVRRLQILNHSYVEVLPNKTSNDIPRDWKEINIFCSLKCDLGHRHLVGGKRIRHMMTSSNGNVFRVTGHLCWEFTGLRWIPRTKASDAELWCFLCSVPK